MTHADPSVEPAYIPAARPRGWVSFRAAGDVFGRFAQEWRGLPPIAWRRWLATLLIGFVASAAVVAGMTRLARPRLGAGTPLAERDALLLRWMADNGPISYSNAILLESFGNLAFMVPLTALSFAVAARRGRPLLALSFVLTYLLQRPLVLLGWQLWDRARPRLVADGIAAPGLHSFPSGHAALTFSVYGLLTWLWVRSSRSWTERVVAVALFLVLVTVVAWSRVVLSTHWPSDILAGWVVALVWLATVITACRRAEAVGGR